MINSSEKLEKAIDTSLNLLFKRENLSLFQESALKRYMKTSVEQNQTCVMYCLSERFTSFLSEINIDPAVIEKKEVIIFQNFNVSFARNYTCPPKEVAF